MKIPATRKDASIWYALFNDPRSPAPRTGSSPKLTRLPPRAVRPPSPEAGEATALASDLVMEQLLSILSDMKREEKRHLEVLSRARALTGAPELSQLLARNVAEIERLVLRLEKVLRQSGHL